MSGRKVGGLSVAALVAVLLLVVLAGLPRFSINRDVDVNQVRLESQPNGWYIYNEAAEDPLLNTYSFDTYSYFAHVEYLRGEFDRYPIYGPWLWRAVPTVVAAQLPFDNPSDAYAAASLGFALIGAASIVLIVAGRRRSSWEQFAAGALYAISFPMIWYGTSGYVDTSLVALIAVALLFIEKKWWIPFLLVVPIGMMTKETFAIVVVVAGARLWAESKEKRHWLPVTVAGLVVAAATFITARVLWDTPRNLGWLPKWGRIGYNTSRPEAVGSAILTFGVIGLLAYLEIRRMRRNRDTESGAAEWRDNLHLAVGTGLGVLVAAYGFATAYADGRHGWTMYPFAAVLAAHYLVRVVAERRQRRAVGAVGVGSA